MSTSVDRPVAAPAASTARGLGFLLFAAGTWGLNWPVLKYLLGVLPPFSVRTSMALFGMGLGVVVALLRGERLRLPVDQIGRTVVYAMLNFGLFSVLTMLTLLWLSASEGVIFVYSMPIWATFISWGVYGERLTSWRLLALALGFAGVLVLVGPGLLLGTAGGLGWSKLPGVGFALAAAVMFAVGTVLAKHRPLQLPPVAGVTWQAAIGAVPPGVLALFEHPDWSRVPLLGWLALLYCGTTPMILAYLAWFRALRLLPSSTAAIGTLIAPVIGVGGSALLLGEPLGFTQLAALGLTLTGVALAVRG